MEQKFLEEKTSEKESLGEKIFTYAVLIISTFFASYWIMQVIR
ncbi:hypothetical protein ES703_08234 [subsurface metagenome]